MGQQPTDMSSHSGILQKERALEKLPAVQTAAQDKMPVKKSAGFAKKIKDFVHRKILFFVFINPLNEGINAASAVADLAGEFTAFAIKENKGGEAIDIVFFCKRLVSGFGFRALLGAAGEVDFHWHQIGFREFLEGRLGKNILRLFFARRAPVRTCESEEDEAILGGGFFEGIVEICTPEFSGL
jgi:hypothetical protein